MKPLNTVEDNLDFVYENLFWAWLDMARDYADFRVLVTKDNVRILNEYAGTFFGRIQGVLLEFVLFQMFRITDQKGKRENQNITVKALPDFLENSYKVKTESLIKKVDDVIEPLRRYRNKVAVHNDREYQLSRAKKWDDIMKGTGVDEVTAYWSEGPNEPTPSSAFPDLTPIVVHGKEYPHKVGNYIQ